MRLLDLQIRGNDRIALTSYTYMISIYLFSRLDVIGDFPVWSV